MLQWQLAQSQLHATTTSTSSELSSPQRKPVPGTHQTASCSRACFIQMESYNTWLFVSGFFTMPLIFFFLIVKNLLKVYHFNYFHVHSLVTLSTFTLSCSRHHCHLWKFPSSQTATLPPRGARCPLRPPPALRLADATPPRGEPHGLSFCDWLPSLSGMSSRQRYCQACGGLQHRVCGQQPGCGRP